MSLPAILVNGKIQKKKLIIELSEGEDIYSCIKESMKINNVKKAGLIDINGEIKNASLNYFLGNSHKNKLVKEIKILKSSGHFELSKKTGLFGTIKISFKEENKNNNYTLVKAIAKEGLKIELEFFEMN